MHRTTLTHWLTTLAILFAIPPSCLASEKNSPQIPKSRTFQFDYAATLKFLPAGKNIRVWLPVPQTNDHQTIKTLSSHLPTNATTAVEPVFGNKILYFETKGPATGELSLKMSYEVRRKEILGLTNGKKIELSDQERKLFLSASEKVPLEGKQLDLLREVNLSNDSLAKAFALYNRVDDHVRYDKSKQGYGNGDVLWVCDSRCGNCSDFHSLFISLARSQGLPARFEIGFPLLSEGEAGTITGYHCWAMFHNNKLGWVPVDISEADKHPELKTYYFGNLTENRVMFTTGRDINLVPQQAGEPLNFFIYPYVEVGGKPLPYHNITHQFHYRSL